MAQGMQQQQKRQGNPAQDEQQKRIIAAILAERFIEMLKRIKEMVKGWFSGGEMSGEEVAMQGKGVSSQVKQNNVSKSLSTTLDSIKKDADEKEIGMEKFDEMRRNEISEAMRDWKGYGAEKHIEGIESLLQDEPRSKALDKICADASKIDSQFLSLYPEFHAIRYARAEASEVVLDADGAEFEINPEAVEKALKPRLRTEARITTEKMEEGQALLRTWGEERLKENQDDSMGKEMIEEAETFELSNKDEYKRLAQAISKFTDQADEEKRIKSENKSMAEKVLDGEMSMEAMGEALAEQNPAVAQQAEIAPEPAGMKM